MAVQSDMPAEIPAETPIAGHDLKLRYFAWVREKTGVADETVSVPAGVETVGDLVTWLVRRGPEFAAAFHKPEVVRAAIDQRHVKLSARLEGAREIAFFPPVTGG